MRVDLLVITLVVTALGIEAPGQRSGETDLRESFDNHLDIYRLNMKSKPKGLEDFEGFVLEGLPGQKIEDPGVDSLGRSPVGGRLTLTDGTVFPIASAFLKINRDKKYEWLTFDTAEVNGKRFKFDGHFLRKRVDWPPSYTYIRGTLMMYKAGKKFLSKDVPFTIYADE